MVRGETGRGEVGATREAMLDGARIRGVVRGTSYNWKFYSRGPSGPIQAQIRRAYY